MKLLPREHGASAIWFSSLLFPFGTLQQAPWVPGVVVFLAASVLALIVTGRLTTRSKVIARMERNPTLLPVLSSPLTLLVPLGQILMVGQLPVPVLAVWLVFLTYSSLGVVYTRDSVRSVLKEVPLTWTSFSLSTAIILALVVTLSAAHWLSITAVAVVVPLLIHRVIVLLLTQRKGFSKIERIRGVGFAQAGNLIAATIILDLILRL